MVVVLEVLERPPMYFAEVVDGGVKGRGRHFDRFAVRDVSSCCLLQEKSQSHPSPTLESVSPSLGSCRQVSKEQLDFWLRTNSGELGG